MALFCLKGPWAPLILNTMYRPQPEPDTVRPRSRSGSPPPQHSSSQNAATLISTHRSSLIARTIRKKAWPVSTRQLLSHTGGIRHYLDFDELTEAAATSADQEALARRRDRERLDDFTRYTDTQSPLDQFSADPLVYEPGTDWLYSSFGYRIIGCVIAGASGVPYREYMRTEVFEPLRMLRTDDDDAWRITPGRAKGYRLQDGVVRRADIRDVSGNLPAGGHLTTATDLVSFAQAFDDGQLVNAASQLEMTSRPGGAAFSLDQPSWRDAIPRQGAYGFGLMIFPAATGYWYGHSGRQAGGSAIVIHDPMHDISIAVLSNAKGWNGYMRLVRRLHAIATDEGRHQSTTGKAGSR